MLQSILYYFVCEQGASQSSESLNVTVLPVGKPTVELKANNTDDVIRIPYNTVVNIQWQSSDAQACNLNSLPVAVSGSKVSEKLTDDKVFQIQCIGPGGSSTDSVKVEVDPPGTTAQLVGINFEDLPIAVRDGDFNDVVLCFAGNFKLNGNQVASTNNQVVRVNVSNRSECDHSMTVNITHADGTREPSINFQSRTQPTLYLNMKFKSRIDVIMKGVGRCAESGTHGSNETNWALIKANECRTTGI
jgi:hypothetical protein